jgi:hypothetical protein
MKIGYLRNIFALAVLAGCGSPVNDTELCSFEVRTEGITTQAASKVINLRGEMPSTCNALTRENEGKIVVQVRLTGPQDEDISLARVQAGTRSKSFDPVSSNLRAGSVDASFSSQSEPDWAVPWSDAPSRFEVAVLAPLDASDDLVPQKATVRLSL